MGYTIRQKIYGSVLRKEIGWHDDRDNGPGVIGKMLNADVGTLSAITIEVTAAYMEGFFGLAIGLGLGFYFSWPITLCVMGIGPIMMISGKVGH